MNRKIWFVAAIVLWGSWPALAHAILLNATPAANQVVDGRSIPVKLRFNARIDAKRSRLSLVSPEGREFPLTIAGQDAPDTIAATAAAVPAGSYILRWQVLATDGHITRGEIPFKAK